MTNQVVSLDSLIGLEFCHYRIIQEIGSGGMDVVSRAHDQQLDREVAIKVLHPGTITDEGARRHLEKINYETITDICLPRTMFFAPVSTCSERSVN